MLDLDGPVSGVRMQSTTRSDPADRRRRQPQPQVRLVTHNSSCHDDFDDDDDLFSKRPWNKAMIHNKKKSKELMTRSALQESTSSSSSGSSSNTQQMMMMMMHDMTYSSHGLTEREEENDKLFEIPVPFGNDTSNNNNSNNNSANSTSSTTILGRLIRQQKFGAALRRLRQHPNEASIWTSSTPAPPSANANANAPTATRSSSSLKSRESAQSEPPLRSLQQQQAAAAQPRKQMRRLSTGCCNFGGDDNDVISSPTKKVVTSQDDIHTPRMLSKTTLSLTTTSTTTPKSSKNWSCSPSKIRPCTASQLRDNSNKSNSTAAAAASVSNKASRRVTKSIRQLPLHLACKSLKQLSSSSLSKAQNQQQQQQDGMNLYKTLNELLVQLIVAHPAACQEPDPQHGVLPLHAAIRYGATPAVIAMLATAFPASIQQPDKYGRTATALCSCSSSSSQQSRKGSSSSCPREQEQVAEIQRLLQLGVKHWEEEQRKTSWERLRNDTTSTSSSSKDETTKPAATTTRRRKSMVSSTLPSLLEQQQDQKGLPVRSVDGRDDATAVSAITFDLDKTISQLQDEYRTVHSNMDQLLLQQKDKRRRRKRPTSINNNNRSRPPAQPQSQAQQQQQALKMKKEKKQQEDPLDVRKVKREFSDLMEKLDELELLVLDTEWMEESSESSSSLVSSSHHQNLPQVQAIRHDELDLPGCDKTKTQGLAQHIQREQQHVLLSPVMSKEKLSRLKRTIGFLSTSCHTSSNKLQELVGVLQVAEDVSMLPLAERPAAVPATTTAAATSSRRPPAARMARRGSTGGGVAALVTATTHQRQRGNVPAITTRAGDIEWKPICINEEVQETDAVGNSPLESDDLTTILRKAAEQYAQSIVM